MKILIIEDEQPAAIQLSQLLESIDHTFEIMDILSSNEELIRWTKTNDWPDLIFSDIELLDGPVFRSFREINPEAPIIFTTAYDHYMADAFETNGIAYLLKPFTEEQLRKTITKYQKLKGGPQKLNSLLQNLESIVNRKGYKNRITIRKGAGMYLLSVEEITYMAMRNGVLHVYDANGKSHLLSMGLTDFYDQLNPDSFFLANRSEGVALQHIERLEAYGQDRLAVFVKGSDQPVIASASRTPRLRKWLEAGG